MRFYSFTNANYMSPLQLGLQTAHCVAEMSQQSKASEIYDDWAKNHKTIVILNGGNCAALEELCTFLDVHQNPYPSACFYEDKESLNGAITAVGIVLPEQVYEAAKYIRWRYIKIDDTVLEFDWTRWTFGTVPPTASAEDFVLVHQYIDFLNESVEKYGTWFVGLISRLNACPLA